MKGLILGLLAVAASAQNTSKTEGTRAYDSNTIHVIMLQPRTKGSETQTEIYLTEKGDANYAIVEAFYYTTVAIDGKPTRLMLHKEATTTVGKNAVWGTSVDIPLDKIEIIRVKELRLNFEREFIVNEDYKKK